MPQLMAFQFQVSIPSSTIVHYASPSSRFTAVRRPSRSGSLAEAFPTAREYGARVSNLTQTTNNLEANETSLEQLEIVDFIQKCRVDHLFRTEISRVLHRHYLESRARFSCTLSLRHTSLRFRLLREQGYNVSSTDIFEGYMDTEGKFEEDRLRKGDIQGLLSLFEASHLSSQDDVTLEQAKTFSEQRLYASIDSLDIPSSQLVRDTLKYPYHVTMARFKADDFILRNKDEAQGWRKEIVDLASKQLDVARAIYNDEVHHIFKWWKELGLTKELKLARDDPSEWHNWSVGILPHPHLSKERIELTKPISLIYIVDDIFDIYGDQEDLCLFTESVNRWDLDTAKKLPYYMKQCLKAVFDVTSHISHEIRVKHGSNPEPQLKKAWTDLFDAYLVESKWHVSRYMPATDEHMTTGRVTCGVPLVLAHLMLLLGQGDSHNYAIMVDFVATILRLGNDLGRPKDEDEVGHDGSYIKCYMNENDNVSLEDANRHLVDEIWKAWKGLNGACLRLPRPPPHPSPYTSTTFEQGCLNLARMVPLMYDCI